MQAEMYRGKELKKYIENYVVFDFETTGISTARDEIIEISAVKVAGHQPVAQFSKLVNPQRPIPAAASRVNGITDRMVADQPVLEAVLPEFLEFIGNETLIGHNIRTFDMPFLYRAAEERLSVPVKNDYIDTLPMARSCLPQLSRHRLVDLAEYFQVSTKGAHRALNDCIMNQLCYESMGKLLRETDTPVCVKCGSLMVLRSGKFGVFYGCTNFPNCRHTVKIRN